MATYNGHKNWNHWNVRLWILNDECLYNSAMVAVKRNPSKNSAAEDMLDLLHCNGITHTPDGAPYSKSAIRAAMVGM